ncbi:hypothetical protein ACA910_018161 [Epithemia clementina (nom. ined.)]
MTESSAVAQKDGTERSQDSSLPSTSADPASTDSITKVSAERKEQDNKSDDVKDQKPNTKAVPKTTAHKKSSNSKKLGYLSTIQKQRVDEVFQSMFGYPWGSMPVVVEATRRPDSRYVLLKQIFGPRSAAQILHNEPLTSENNQPLHQKSGDSVNQTQLVPARNNATIKARTTTSAPTAAVASSDSQYKNMGPAAAAVATSSSSTEGAPSNVQGSNPSAPEVGVDALLQQMQGPKSTSTIMKTAIDWESFKEESGALGEKLEQHAESKGAYLKRQDFLTRVDHRQFEQERQERERSRARKS